MDNLTQEKLHTLYGAIDRLLAQKGHILLAIDGQPILTGEDLDRVLYASDIGDHVTLTIYRAGEQGTLTLTVEEETAG